VALWASEGVADGAILLKYFASPEGDVLFEPVEAGDRLYFVGLDPEHGLELWVTDGTPDGTRLVKDINPGPDLADPRELTLVGSRLFFHATDPLRGDTLWALDLTEPPVSPRFHRADPNSSGTTDISDAVSIFGYLFLGEPEALGCLESADVQNDGVVDISDGIAVLGYLFLGDRPPAPPGSVSEPCGQDPDLSGSPGDLGCVEYAGC
jgi:ELWxxDGT repeat protein